MKGYDFSRKGATPDRKDKQWDWINEELERIWDALYNHRFQYPNQVEGQDLLLTLPHPENKLFGLIVPTSPATAGGGMNGSGLIDAVNLIGGVTTNQSYVEGMYGAAQTATTAGSTVGWRAGQGGGGTVANPNLLRFSQNPYFLAIIKTGSTLTGSRVFCGFANRNAAYNNTASGHDESIGSNVAESLWFGWSDDGTTPYWRLHHSKSGSTGSFFISKDRDTGTGTNHLSTVTANTIYMLRMWVLSDAFLNDADNVPFSGVLIVETSILTPRNDAITGVYPNVIYPFTRTDVQSWQQILQDDSGNLIDVSQSAGVGCQTIHIAAAGSANQIYLNRIYVEQSNFPLIYGSNPSAIFGSAYYL